MARLPRRRNREREPVRQQWRAPLAPWLRGTGYDLGREALGAAEAGTLDARCGLHHPESFATAPIYPRTDILTRGEGELALFWVEASEARQALRGERRRLRQLIQQLKRTLAELRREITAAEGRLDNILPRARTGWFGAPLPVVLVLGLIALAGETFLAGTGLIGALNIDENQAWGLAGGLSLLLLAAGTVKAYLDESRARLLRATEPGSPGQVAREAGAMRGVSRLVLGSTAVLVAGLIAGRADLLVDQNRATEAISATGALTAIGAGAVLLTSVVYAVGRILFAARDRVRLVRELGRLRREREVVGRAHNQAVSDLVELSSDDQHRADCEGRAKRRWAGWIGVLGAYWRAFAHERPLEDPEYTQLHQHQLAELAATARCPWGEEGELIDTRLFDPEGEDFEGEDLDERRAA